jgi:hypothetical protein
MSGVQFGAQLDEGGVDVGRCAATVINLGDALFKVDPAFDLPQDLVRGTEHAVEQMELVLQQLQHTLVGCVTLVQEVDDHHVKALAVAVAAADALLHALRVPGQVVVDDERAELQVDALGRGLGSDEDL